MNHFRKTISRPSFFKQLACMIYDTLLLLSVLLAASAIAVTFNGGKAFEQGNLFFISYLLFVSFLFYGWFWTHGGQTLGMQSWKIKLVNRRSDSPVSWQQAGLRFITSLISWLPAGLGFWWQYFGHNNKSWPDIVSDTALQQLNKS